jgi:hypothetical protein
MLSYTKWKKISARILKAFDGPVPPDRRRGQLFIQFFGAQIHKLQTYYSRHILYTTIWAL